METPQNSFELAIREIVREMTKQQLTKRTPSIPDLDYRRLTYFLIEDRIRLYKEVEKQGQHPSKKKEKKKTLENILNQFGITKKAYYAWYEKYHVAYLKAM